MCEEALKTTSSVNESKCVLKVKVIFDLYFYQVLYVLCLYKAQISGERVQDLWSSGLIFVGIGVNFACDDFIFYVILKKGCLSPGKLANCH